VIVLGTNVVSEPMKAGASQALVEWLDQQDASTQCLTAIGLSELLVGTERLSDDRRKRRLDQTLASLLDRLLGSRVLPIDRHAATVLPALVQRATRRSVSIAVADAKIAAVAASRGFALATRDHSVVSGRRGHGDRSLEGQTRRRRPRDVFPLGMIGPSVARSYPRAAAERDSAAECSGKR
jgi:hypothetical protein